MREGGGSDAEQNAPHSFERVVKDGESYSNYTQVAIRFGDIVAAGKGVVF